jgi:beta-glucosidase
MVNKKSLRHNKKPRKFSVNNWRLVFAPPQLRRWMLLLILFVAFIVTGRFVFINEDLGPQLPAPPDNAIYKQKDQPIALRVSDLLARMTLEEKIGQMALVDIKSLKKTGDVSRYYLGGVLSGAGAKPTINTPAGWLEMTNSVKQQAAASRLGIPLLYGVDANHGHANVPGATVFPHAIGFGASQDVELVQSVAQVTAEELSATGINWSFSPSLDAPKDIRWGRVYEAFSDDPDLNARLGAAHIKGTQMPLTNQTNVQATAKHYLGTGSMVWGQSNHKRFRIDQGKINADNATLANEFLPPYKAAVNADVASVMVGLNQWGDDRVIDSKYLLTDTLKGELGFKGFIVSDWYGAYEYARKSDYQANISAINAGLDMVMLPYDYKSFMADVRKAVKNGSISQARIDDAVSRILYQKFKAGLFDAPQSTNKLDSVGSANHRQLARRAVASSAVLLKNNNSTLPLPKNNSQIFIAGSSADNVGRQSGAWTIEWQGVDGNWMPGVTSILQGLRQVAGPDATIEYDLNASFKSNAKADIGIAIVGEKPYAEGWGDNSNPALDASDKKIIQRLRASSNKLLIVIVSGRPLLMSQEINQADAVVAAWLPGSEGAGVADVLFGIRDFNAKLPLPWPSSLSQIPVRSNGTTSDGTKPLFERGFGLTY